MSLIIPTYNRARLVRRAIESALGQDYPVIDVIVVDDGSTDETPEVLAAFAGDPRVRTIRHEHNRGVTAAKNTGLDLLGQGTAYFGILDSDDTLEPGAIDALVRVFESSGDDYSTVLGWCRDMDSGAPTGEMTHLVGREGLVTYDDALAGHYQGEFWHLARKDLLGHLRFEERASGGEASLWYRLLRHHPGWLVPDVVRAYDTSGMDRVSRRGYTATEAHGMMWVHLAVLSTVGVDLRAKYPGEYGRYVSEMAKWAALAGDGRRARAAAREGTRYAPSARALLMLALALMPSSIVHSIAEARGRVRRREAGPA